MLFLSVHCPFCDAHETKVIDTRLTAEGDRVRRRRQCLQCHARFTTYEVAELTMPVVVKRDGRREPFNEDKLRSGLDRALEKRPVSTDHLEHRLRRLLHDVRGHGEREIPSHVLGEWVMNHLRQLDQVAYVRFASVYRSFDDLDAFRKELERLQAEGSN